MKIDEKRGKEIRNASCVIAISGVACIVLNREPISIIIGMSSIAGATFLAGLIAGYKECLKENKLEAD